LTKLDDGSARCPSCGTALRPGQPHTALEPTPHRTLEMLVVLERPEVTAARDGSHGELAC